MTACPWHLIKDELTWPRFSEPQTPTSRATPSARRTRRVLTYVLNVATEPGFVIDDVVLRSMHFMLLERDPSKCPGRYRTDEIFVRDDRRGVNVYAGPDGEAVRALMRTLSESLSAPKGDDPLVRRAMGHLNLVMIHPFRDGNGRMARTLQTMVSACGPTTCRPRRCAGALMRPRPSGAGSTSCSGLTS